MSNTEYYLRYYWWYEYHINLILNSLSLFHLNHFPLVQVHHGNLMNWNFSLCATLEQATSMVAVCLARAGRKILYFLFCFYLPWVGLTEKQMLSPRRLHSWEQSRCYERETLINRNNPLIFVAVFSPCIIQHSNYEKVSPCKQLFPQPAFQCLIPYICVWFACTEDVYEQNQTYHTNLNYGSPNTYIFLNIWLIVFYLLLSETQKLPVLWPHFH